MNRSIATIWIVMTPLSALGLLCVLLARKYTLKRNVVKAGEQKPEIAESAVAEEKQRTSLEGVQEAEEVTEPNAAEANNVATKLEIKE
jgi:hypothetical protein